MTTVVKNSSEKFNTNFPPKARMRKKAIQSVLFHLPSLFPHQLQAKNNRQEVRIIGFESQFCYMLFMWF